MSLSLSVHPQHTENKVTLVQFCVSHFKPQRSCTYRGMLSRKQNQNSATSTTVHVQGKKLLLLCAFNNYPQTIVLRWHELLTHFPPLFKDWAVLPTFIINRHTILQKVLGQLHRADRAKANMAPCTLLLYHAALCSTYFWGFSSGQELLWTLI